MKSKFISFLDVCNGVPCELCRPDRDEVISSDEIINLIITLNTTHSVNEFLEEIA